MSEQAKSSIDQTKLHDLLFDVRRSVRYHNRRRLFYDRICKGSDALTAIFGSATIITLLGSTKVVPPETPMYMAGITAILSVINLVFDTKENARLHHDLARDFITIEKNLIAPHLTPEKFAEAEARRLDIEAEEPPVLKVLDLTCHNDLLKAMGYEEEHYYKIGFWRSAFANFFDLFPGSIKKAG
ncbi:hypothetical protein SAMN02745124_00195 [Desulfofustis glycolicus DSM 9705]|uniref:SMODS and SLOG-associating 2TM effector domain-containing protein n=2 Tax=Desulfofustis glycolicus TaxID=51195 RepID=A0A1M5S747_9BACT|nr:hypothetical protein SAMN02745124_00195 [Desulfofustis glycolicus DSM 9705]